MTAQSRSQRTADGPHRSGLSPRGERTDSQQWKPQIPRTWDDAALADWATPVAGLNVRPTHMTAKEYYALPTENVRTYPVYVPDREPRGYWEMLQRVGPKPLIEPDAVGPKPIGSPRGGAYSTNSTIWRYVRSIPSGLRRRAARIRSIHRARRFCRRVKSTECAGCQPARGSHFRFQIVPVATWRTWRMAAQSSALRRWRAASTARLRCSWRSIRRIALVPSAIPFRMGDEPFGMWLYRAFGVPWAKDDIHERLKTMTPAELPGLLAAGARGGAIPRWNGSLFYPVKVPDLIGVKDRKYLDATATHLHRGIGDLMRYAALVSTAEPARIGHYNLLPPDARRVEARLPDEALYALAYTFAAAAGKSKSTRRKRAGGPGDLYPRGLRRMSYSAATRATTTLEVLNYRPTSRTRWTSCPCLSEQIQDSRCERGREPATTRCHPQGCLVSRSLSA